MLEQEWNLVAAYQEKLFINNANDTRPVLGLYDDFGDQRLTSSQPRVIGIRIRYKY